jgi:hypothetical protein
MHIYIHTKGSIVTAEMTIRCKSLNTAKDPGGVKYYDTKIGMNMYICSYFYVYIYVFVRYMSIHKVCKYQVFIDQFIHLSIYLGIYIYSQSMSDINDDS